MLIKHQKTSGFQIFSGKKTTIIDIVFWDFLMFDKIFFSPQEKRSVIISNKHGIYELTHELPKDLRLKLLRFLKLYLLDHGYYLTPPCSNLIRPELPPPPASPSAPGSLVNPHSAKPSHKSISYHTCTPHKKSPPQSKQLADT